MTVLRPMGGRGKKETYETKVIRVPLPLIPLIDWLADRFYQTHYSGKPLVESSLYDMANRLELVIVEKSELMAIAQNLLTQKKSSKVTVTKLLQLLSGDPKLTL